MSSRAPLRTPEIQNHDISRYIVEAKHTTSPAMATSQGHATRQTMRQPRRAGVGQCPMLHEELAYPLNKKLPDLP
ncbi:hypothetical protein PCO31111_00291 [Pandoraea communis]|uniref:Uncharacterized protein n=1 Tax=Pandoraea communis TaxID=2508297 RepID=A0A5E4RMM7_9BURK|nr:hypothetical protein PCO31111_00291 [Pandoraea communis]